MSRELLIDIYLILVVWGATVGIMSVTLHSRVRWRATEMGRHLMFYMGMIALVFVLTALRMIFTWNQNWFFLLNVIVFTGVPLAMTQRLWLQWKVYRGLAEEPPSTPPHGETQVDERV